MNPWLSSSPSCPDADVRVEARWNGRQTDAQGCTLALPCPSHWHMEAWHFRFVHVAIHKKHAHKQGVQSWLTQLFSDPFLIENGTCAWHACVCMWTPALFFGLKRHKKAGLESRHPWSSSSASSTRNKAFEKSPALSEILSMMVKSFLSGVWSPALGWWPGVLCKNHCSQKNKKMAKRDKTS